MRNGPGAISSLPSAVCPSFRPNIINKLRPGRDLAGERGKYASGGDKNARRLIKAHILLAHKSNFSAGVQFGPITFFIPPPGDGGGIATFCAKFSRKFSEADKFSKISILSPKSKAHRAAKSED